MNTSFKKEQLEKYVEVTYQTKIDNLPFRLKHNSSQYCLNESEADNFIDKIKTLEKTISEELSKRNLAYKTEFIILTYMQVIESIANGFDIRKNMSDEELAFAFVNGYHKKYQEALSFCNGIIEMYEKGAKDETFTKHWRDYGKHNELVDEYNLNVRKFKDTDFKTNLETLNKSADELLNMLKELNSK